jgi:murein DD-endopeptidase MepM/ murein hydrolase activator NlpD
MPQVPTSFVPQVGVSGESANVQFVAPGVAPMQNLAAEQQVELGRTTQSVGQTLWRIGQIMTDDINSARAKQADSQFLDAANEILRGKQGYMYSRGQDADAKFQATQDAIAERAQAIQDSLDNNVQRQMFQQATARNLSNFRTQMYGHRNEQVVKWNAAESSARAERYVGEAVTEYRSRGDNAVDRNGNPTGKFAVNARNAMDEAVRSARLAGYPDDSEAMLGIKRKVMDDIAKGVAGRLMQDDDFSGGIRYLDSIREQMSPATYEQVRNTLVVAQERQAGLELGESIVEGRGLSTVAGTAPFVNVVATPTKTTAVREGIGELEQQARGGVIIEAELGSQIVAPYDGVIMGVERENGTLTIGVQLENGDIATIGNVSGISESAIALYEGKVVSRGETIGIMGNSALQYSLSRNGEPLSMDRVNSIDMRETPRLPGSEQEALAMSNGIENRTTREIARARIREIYSERDAAAKNDYESLLGEATALVARGQQIPGPMFAALSPKDRKALTTPFADYDSVSALEETYRTPGIVTMDWLAENKGKFTEGTWNSLMGKASAASKEASSVDAQHVNATLEMNGFRDLAFPSNDDQRAQSLLLRQRIEETLRRERQSGEVDDARRQQIIDNAIMNFGEVTERSWMNLFFETYAVRPAPLESMTLEQREMVAQRGAVYRNVRGTRILLGQYEAIRAAIIQAGKAATDDAIRKVYEAGANR